MATAAEIMLSQSRSSAQGPDPNDFDNLDQVKQRLADFERLYNQIAEPFAWNFTREKLNTWLARLSAHENSLAA